MNIKYDLYVFLYKIALKKNSLEEFLSEVSKTDQKSVLIEEEKLQKKPILSKIWHVAKSSPKEFFDINKTADFETIGEYLGINSRTIQSWVWDRKKIPDISRMLIGYIYITNGKIKSKKD